MEFCFSSYGRQLAETLRLWPFVLDFISLENLLVFRKITGRAHHAAVLRNAVSQRQVYFFNSDGAVKTTRTKRRLLPWGYEIF
jgi:hypothetical protein